jgi:16S rRNA (uracil1498-N3)-methyltransferase
VATPDIPVVLLAALLKASRWEWMIEKAAELGATRVVPVQADRCVVQVPPRKAAAKLERWGRIGAAAARQSQQMQAPVFNAPASLRDALTQVEGCALVRLDFAGDPETLVEAARGPIALIVGPEGGFTDAERTLLIEHGARAASLGAAVLRAETAAVAALAAVRLHRTIR